MARGTLNCAARRLLCQLWLVPSWFIILLRTSAHASHSEACVSCRTDFRGIVPSIQLSSRGNGTIHASIMITTSTRKSLSKVQVRCLDVMVINQGTYRSDYPTFSPSEKKPIHVKPSLVRLKDSSSTKDLTTRTHFSGSILGTSFLQTISIDLRARRPEGLPLVGLQDAMLHRRIKVAFIVKRACGSKCGSTFPS